MMKLKISHKKHMLLELLNSLQVFGKVYVEGLFEILKARKEKLNNINDNYATINILTYSAIIVFFSFAENIAISIKRTLVKANEASIISVGSKKKNEILNKDERELSFEDMMKLTFSILPSIFGENNYYGSIKNKELSKLFFLRTIRNNAIHPKGIEDFLISLKMLDGKDINEPMIRYLESLRNVINICAKKLDTTNVTTS